MTTNARTSTEDAAALLDDTVAALHEHVKNGEPITASVRDEDGNKEVIVVGRRWNAQMLKLALEVAEKARVGFADVPNSAPNLLQAEMDRMQEQEGVEFPDDPTLPTHLRRVK